MNKNTFLFTFRKAKTDVYSLIIITTTITLTIYHYMKQRRSATLRVKSSKGIVWSFFFFFFFKYYSGIRVAINNILFVFVWLVNQLNLRNIAIFCH